MVVEASESGIRSVSKRCIDSHLSKSRSSQFSLYIYYIPYAAISRHGDPFFVSPRSASLIIEKPKEPADDMSKPVRTNSIVTFHPTVFCLSLSLFSIFLLAFRIISSRLRCNRAWRSFLLLLQLCCFCCCCWSVLLASVAARPPGPGELRLLLLGVLLLDNLPERL